MIQRKKQFPQMLLTIKQRKKPPVINKLNNNKNALILFHTFSINFKFKAKY